MSLVWCLVSIVSVASRLGRGATRSWSLPGARPEPQGMGIPIGHGDSVAYPARKGNATLRQSPLLRRTVGNSPRGLYGSTDCGPGRHSTSQQFLVEYRAHECEDLIPDGGRRTEGSVSEIEAPRRRLGTQEKLHIREGLHPRTEPGEIGVRPAARDRPGRSRTSSISDKA